MAPTAAAEAMTHAGDGTGLISRTLMYSGSMRSIAARFFTYQSRSVLCAYADSATRSIVPA